MKMRKMQLALSAGALALSLALAGCGGGGGSANNTPAPPAETPETDDQRAVRLANEAHDATADLQTATSALKTLAADTGDGSAVVMAKKYAGMLGPISVAGDSSKAMTNASMVLQAKMRLEMAITDVENAIDDAEAAKDELPDGSSVIDNAVGDANKEIMAAQEVLDGKEGNEGTLAYYVAMVTGGGKDPKGDEASKGKEVADAINKALTTSAQVPPVGDNFTSVPTDTNAMTGKVMAGPSDAQGMTWAEIGGSGLMNMRIAAAAGGGTMSVMAKSVDGMTAEKLGQDQAPSSTDDGAQTSGTYKGIAGTLFCAGEDCKAGSTVTDKLTGSWYFAPTAAAATTYVEGDADGTYSMEDPVDYVRYGYWLSEDGGNININRYADGPDAQSTQAVYGVDSNVDAFAETSATYEGEALGMSVVTMTDSKGKVMSRASGGFTADVSLTMMFGGSPSLSGMITGFDGSAVDSDWVVDLKKMPLNGGQVTAGTAGGDYVKSGSWTATAWGGSAEADEQARPTGVYGAFDAMFTNGAAAGVYATRKE